MSATMQALSTATQSSAPAQRSGGFPALLERYKGEIARALPRHLNPDQMLRIALTCFRMNPKLEQCDRDLFLPPSSKRARSACGPACSASAT